MMFLHDNESPGVFLGISLHSLFSCSLEFSAQTIVGLMFNARKREVRWIRRDREREKERDSERESKRRR